MSILPGPWDKAVVMRTWLGKQPISRFAKSLMLIHAGLGMKARPSELFWIPQDGLDYKPSWKAGRSFHQSRTRRDLGADQMNPVRDFVRWYLRKKRLTTVPVSQAPTFLPAMQRLQKRNLRLGTLIDVGASNGA